MPTVEVLSYNTLFVGRDGQERTRADAQVQLINELCPDVFLMQEAKCLDADGGAGFYALEKQIGMRSFLAPAQRTGQNLAIFIRAPLRAVRFNADTMHFHHSAATLRVEIPGAAAPVTFISTHLCSNGPAVRRCEAAYLGVQTLPNRLTLLAGDFNSASPHDPEPADWHSLAQHHRAPYLADDIASIDRSVLAYLEAAGWVVWGICWTRIGSRRCPPRPNRMRSSRPCVATTCWHRAHWRPARRATKSSAVRSPMSLPTIPPSWPASRLHKGMPCFSPVGRQGARP